MLDGYQLVRQLGSGGMGVVFEAADSMGRRVALKVLRHRGAREVEQFKREFRSLEGLEHPNLVELYELVALRDKSYFTMELVDGQNMLTYLRHAGPRLASGTGSQQALNQDSQPSSGGAPRIERIRAVFGQLIDGIAALHGAGKLHRDIKPSNVLVSRADSRVVVVDFGLSTDVSASLSGDFIVGTPRYIAPELLTGSAPGPESDWYSIGALLYEAIAARPPFDGPLMDVMLAKVERDPPPPRLFAPDAPEELCDLAMDLLHRDPTLRPGYDEIVARLGAAREHPLPALRGDSGTFVGRAEQLSTFAEVVDGSRSAVQLVEVRGPAGMGKSQLLNELARRQEAEGSWLVLRGRCHPHERIPFNALDAIASQLGRWLRKVPQTTRLSILPTETTELFRLFPTLRALQPDAELRSDADPHEARRLAFDSFAQLFEQLCVEVPVLLSIDDLHLSDSDSIELLRAVLRRCTSRLVVVVSCADDGEHNGAPVELLREDIAAWEDHLHRTKLAVEPMARAEIEALAVSLLDVSPNIGDTARIIAAEARGNPWLAIELTKHAAALVTADKYPVGDLLRSRIERLDLELRAVLELISIAGRSVAERVVSDAANLAGSSSHPIHRLERAGFVHSGSRAGELYLDVHEQTRRAVLESLTDDQRATLHHELACALDRTRAPAEQLVRHWELAGKPELAAEAAERAADDAFAMLAFGLAADHYRRAIELDPRRQRQPAVLTRLAESLSYSGRGREAAEMYMEAADQVESLPRLQLQRRATEAFLSAGYLDLAFAAISETMESVSVSVPKPRWAKAALVWERAALRLRGLTPRRRRRRATFAELMAVDVCRLMATGLGSIDPIRGGYFQVRHTRLALDSGDPGRIAVALASEAAYSAVRGRRNDARTSRLLSLAQDQADGQDALRPKAFVVLVRGIVASLTARWPEARARCAEAVALLQDGGETDGWELAAARVYHIRSLVPAGDFARLAPMIDAAVQDAEERSDLFTATTCRTGYLNLVWLSRGDVERARVEACDAIAAWPGRVFHIPHYFDLLAQTHIDMAANDGRGALDRVLATWPLLIASNLRYVQVVRVSSWDLRGRAALAAAAAGELEHLAEVRTAIRALRRMKSPSAAAFALLLESGVAMLEGRRDDAMTSIANGIAACEAQSLELYAEFARRRLADLSRLDKDDERLTRRGISRPEILARVFTPGVYKLSRKR